MRNDLFALAASILLTASIAGCSTPTTSGPTATSSLKVLIRPEWSSDATSSWNLNEVKATVSNIAVTRGGNTVGTAKLSDSETELLYHGTFRSVDVPAGSYDGLKLTMNVNSTLLWLNDNQGIPLSSSSVPININNPLSFVQPLQLPPNKRTVLVFKPNLKKMGEPGAFNLTPSCFTIESFLQELVSPNGYPMAYFNHFMHFSFADPDGNTEYADVDLFPGPFGPGNAAAFTSDWDNGVQLKQIVDLGEKELKAIATVPPADQFVSQAGITPGHCYVTKTKKGNYAKFRVISMKENWMDDINGIAIEYLNQTDGSTTFSK